MPDFVGVYKVAGSATVSTFVIRADTEDEAREKAEEYIKHHAEHRRGVTLLDVRPISS